MIKYIKKLCILIIIVLVLYTTSSCSSQKDVNELVDGNMFIYNDSFAFENHIYQIYQLNNLNLLVDDELNSSFLVMYKEKNKLDANTWIIKYYDNYQYIVTKDVDDKLLDAFYDMIKDDFGIFEEKLNMTLITDYDNSIHEMEFIVDTSLNFESVLLIDLYVPFKINGYETFIVYVPIKTFLAYKNNDVLLIKSNELFFETTYSNFIQQENVKEK